MNDEIISNLNERLDRTIDKGRAIVADDDFQQRLEQIRGQAEETIRKHPVKSVLIGLAAGIILGKILSSDD
jgi:ElaB/YqjD/DUF883 family membrane-anchored ribosome-binding protein